MLVRDDLRKCVAFVGFRIDGVFRPRATAFFVCVLEQGLMFRHVVTAKHVVEAARRTGADQIWLRINVTSGGTAEIAIPLDIWALHPEDDSKPTDVATCIFNRIVEEEDLILFPILGKEELAGTTAVLRETSFGVGSEVAIVGLFRSHFGQQRNIPIVRIGNVCALSEEPVQTSYGYIDAHLIEARSIGGLSGSPVFTNQAPHVVDRSGTVRVPPGRSTYLLGLVHGHFDIPDLRESTVIDDGTGVRGLNSGIGVVVPVEKIIETIEQPRFKLAREKILSEHAAGEAYCPEKATPA